MSANIMKTSELTGTALDWAVAKALGHALKIRTWKDITDTLDPIEDADIIAFHKERNTVRVSVEQIPGGGWFPNPRYSTNWSQGGPIIEREGIGTAQAENGSDWVAMRRYTFQRDDAYWDGPTPLVAAMRCYVASKLGDSVDIPAAIAKATQET